MRRCRLFSHILEGAASAYLSLRGQRHNFSHRNCDLWTGNETALNIALVLHSLLKTWFSREKYRVSSLCTCDFSIKRKECHCQSCAKGILRYLGHLFIDMQRRECSLRTCHNDQRALLGDRGSSTGNKNGRSFNKLEN